MRTGVVIPTVGRPHEVERIVTALLHQSRVPDRIAVCAPSSHDVPEEVASHERVIFVDGVCGASVQRNAALGALADDGLDLVAFFDDDSMPRRDYLKTAEDLFRRHPCAVGMTGRLARDGAAEHRELSEAEMSTALEDSWQAPAGEVRPTRGLYGTNIVVRGPLAHATPFDERLPLYSWLEDLDFSRRLARSGELLQADPLVVVHQGRRSGGRTQFRRLGYSQVSNVAHLVHKGSIPVSEAVPLVGRPVLGALRGAVLGPERAGSRRRLGGMVTAVADLVRGRVTPERILDLEG